MFENTFKNYEMLLYRLYMSPMQADLDIVKLTDRVTQSLTSHAYYN